MTELVCAICGIVMKITTDIIYSPSHWTDMTGSKVCKKNLEFCEYEIFRRFWKDITVYPEPCKLSESIKYKLGMVPFVSHAIFSPDKSSGG